MVALFETEGRSFKAELNHRFKTEEEAAAFLNKLKGADSKVGELETKPAKRSPAPPFTTSTLQQEASRKLGFSVAQTMQVAQKLYEAASDHPYEDGQCESFEQAIQGLNRDQQFLWIGIQQEQKVQEQSQRSTGGP